MRSGTRWAGRPSWPRKRIRTPTLRRRCCQGSCEPAAGEPVAVAVRRGLQPRRGRPAGATSPVPGAAASRSRGRRPGRRQETERGRGRKQREDQVDGSAYGHVPVMAGRVAQLLVPALQATAPHGEEVRPPAVMVDATLGRAGHARALLAQCPGLALIGIDADEAAIEHGRALAEEYPGQVTLAHSFYDRIASIVAEAGYRRVQGVLFDLGVSSPQLDDFGRGFSYAREAPLDMRMDQ